MPVSFSLVADHVTAPRRAAAGGKAWAPSTEKARSDAGLGQSGQVLHFAADSEIYADGDRNVSLYTIVSGVVRTCKFRSDGRRQIDAFYVAGDIFGFEAGGEHTLSAEAVNDVSLIACRWRGVEAFGAEDERMARRILSASLRELRRSQEHALLLGRRSAFQKVATFLTDMSERSPNRDMLDLAMSRQDIADYLGLTIETVSRTLSQLERNETISLTSARRVCILERAALRDLGL